MKYINMIGCEIEGGWESPPDNCYYDGSVNVACRHVGEYHTPPCRSLRSLRKHLKRNMPTRTNLSCGWHIHFSLKSPTYYSVLMDKNFVDGMVKCMKTWAKKRLSETHPFFDRISGKNSYCRINLFCPDLQVEKYEKESCRYSLINFCFSLHGTFECRFPPAFNNAEDYLSMIKKIVQFVNGFLDKNLKNEREISITLKEKEDDEIEEIKCCIE